MAQGPLDGIRILDFSQIIAGPLGCMLLADLGAEVIKVEPVEGEPWRLTSMFMPLESKPFQSLNRGKQSIALDLTHPTCRDAIRRLVRTCDVVVINYRPDVSQQLGIDYESLRAERADLIYVDSTAFGRNGPWAHRPGYDIVAQAASGLLMQRGATDDRGAPALSGAAAPADFTTAYAIAWGVCAALFHRQRTGDGQKVETSLLANALILQSSTFMSLPAADAERRHWLLEDLRESRARGEPLADLLRRRRIPPETTAGGGVYYRGYLTADGALALGCLSASIRLKMRQSVGFEDPTDDPTAELDPAEIKRLRLALPLQVEAIMKTRTTAEWVEIFDRNGVPASPVMFVEELLDDPQVVENGYVVSLDHDLSGPQQMAAPPLKMSATPPAPQGAAPPLGRDTRRWLEATGLTADEVEALAAEGAVRLDDA